MIIDDDEVVVRYLSSLFEDNGYVTCSAASSTEGLAVVRTEKPDLITLDLSIRPVEPFFAIEKGLHSLLVALLALGVAIYGTVVSVALPIDVLPDLNRPTVTILTEAHGLGMRTTATMMFGVGEPIDARIEHFLGVREIQDRTGGILNEVQAIE